MSELNNLRQHTVPSTIVEFRILFVTGLSLPTNVFSWLEFRFPPLLFAFILLSFPFFRTLLDQFLQWRVMEELEEKVE